jgi:hypothetical protein
MRNPNFVPPVIVPVNPARLNVIRGLVTAYLATQAARSDIDDSEIIALAPEFAAVPGTLKAIKDRIGLT